MARDRLIEARLQRWAQWLNVGDGSGYPVISVLHPEWQPPSPGITPTMKSVAGGDERSTHRAVARMSQRLANTLVVHYVMRLPVATQAERLGCTEGTVHARVDLAHRMLAEQFPSEATAGGFTQ